MLHNRKGIRKHIQESKMNYKYFFNKINTIFNDFSASFESYNNTACGHYP